MGLRGGEFGADLTAASGAYQRAPPTSQIEPDLSVADPMVGGGVHCVCSKLSCMHSAFEAAMGMERLALMGEEKETNWVEAQVFSRFSINEREWVFDNNRECAPVTVAWCALKLPPWSDSDDQTGSAFLTFSSDFSDLGGRRRK
ncbi:hypothetical protein RJT34_21570 [Clitoria ternatea]|uniref:Uncharacterized protein n=1 Tax=Clitoria ternatea TaxID=43366 RepID=A0AAN9P5S9_CLITE